jgi:uncharacterized SAM-binding protein YcdF (DUF218 family)
MHIVYIVILGHVTDQVMKKRVYRALEEVSYLRSYLQSKVKIYLILSGGKAGGATKSEAVRMRSMIDPIYYSIIDDIILEDKSMSTMENVIYTNEIPLEKDRGSWMIICTSSFHIRRSAVLSSLLLKGHTLQYIHTNEKVSDEEMSVETEKLLANMDEYTSTIL